MNRKLIAYWTATVVIALVEFVGGIVDLAHGQMISRVLESAVVKTRFEGPVHSITKAG